MQTKRKNSKKAGNICNGMKCPMCGYIFNEERAAKACKGCIIPKLYKGCKLVKCPNCGYEMPIEPKWIKKFLGRR